MSNEVSHSPGMKEISHPRFAAFYNWMMDQPLVRRGFDPLRRETVGQAHGIVLEVGAVTDAVTVTAEASVLQTENAVVGQVIDNRYTTQIPLNGRDFSQLLLLSPGTTTRPGGFDLSVGSATGSSGSGIAIGGRDSQNNFTLDGASNNARQFGNIE